MKLTSHLYTAYTKVLNDILSGLAANTLDHAELYTLAQNSVEKIIPLCVPALIDCSLSPPTSYLSPLKKAWIKTVLSDIRLPLLVPRHILDKIQHGLNEVNPLFDLRELDLFRPPNGDPFASEPYLQIMRIMVDARKNRHIVRLLYKVMSNIKDSGHNAQNSEHNAQPYVCYTQCSDLPCSYSEKHMTMTGSFLPLSINYDPSTDRFCALLQKIESGSPISTFSLDIAHIIDARFASRTAPAHPVPVSPPKSPSLFEDYVLVPPPEPLLLEISSGRTVFDRCRHAFASFSQRTQYDRSSHIYTCMISYKPQEEDIVVTLLTDLDPSIRILSPSHMAQRARTNRLRRQELAKQLNLA